MVMNKAISQSLSVLSRTTEKLKQTESKDLQQRAINVSAEVDS